MRDQLKLHPEWGLRVIGFMDEQDVPHDSRIPATRVHEFVDLEYIDSWSLTLDLRILARTVPAILNGTGA